jgi:hypothetical protein
VYFFATNGFIFSKAIGLNVRCLTKKVKSMGTYNKGILGAFSGKVGPVVGASWRGKDVLRSLPKRVRRIPTPQQEAQRLRFSFVSAFLTPFYPVLRRFYGGNTTTQTRINHAMSYHLRDAVIENGGLYEMDYAKVVMTKGDLTGLENPQVTAAVGATLNFTWVDNSGQGQAKADDQLVISLFEETTKTSLYTLYGGDRSLESASFNVPETLIGLDIQVWLGVASDDEKRYATSVYLGAVNVL